jgi:hypothetical protein
MSTVRQKNFVTKGVEELPFEQLYTAKFFLKKVLTTIATHAEAKYRSRAIS